MIVGIMIIDIHCPYLHSLKEKRQVVSSIKEKLRHKFNISIIESDYQALWQKTQLAVSTVSHARPGAESVFNQVEDFISRDYPVQLIDIDKQYI